MGRKCDDLTKFYVVQLGIEMERPRIGRRRWLQFTLRSFLAAAVLAGLLTSWGARQVLQQEVHEPWDVPREWAAGDFDRKTGKWSPENAKNVKWVAPLGSVAHGSPVVAGGKVFIGTNNGHGYVARYPDTTDLGVLLCLSAQDGSFLWQHSNEKLPAGRVNDWPLQGVCSDPWVEGDRLWYVNNRCEVVCLDTEGFHDDENDGPFRHEPHKERGEADVVWKLDMYGELGVSPHNMSRCNVIAVGSRLFVGTSNGVDESHIRIPNPQAPSFLCLDKQTGRVLWHDNSPGVNILHGQWGSPAYGVFAGVPQVIFPGGDGWLYSFDPAGGNELESRLLWKFDCNPKTSKWVLGGRGTRNNLIAAPVIYRDRVYVVVGQEPEHGEGRGHLWCIDPTRRGDVSAELVFNKGETQTQVPHRRLQACVLEEGDFTRPNPNSALLWHFDGVRQPGAGKIVFEEEMHRAIGTPAIKDGMLFVGDFSGLFHCIDAGNGKQYWTYDLQAACWSSPVVVGDHVYICDEDGDVAVFRVTPDPEVAMPFGEPVRTNMLPDIIYATPTAVDGVLYIADRNHLFAISAEEN